MLPLSAYDRFMGRYSGPLAPLFADFAGVAAGQRVLDVGCGPGALTAELVRRLQPENVSAVDPSEPFVAAIRDRHPTVSVKQATAEELPFEDDVVRRRVGPARCALHGRSRGGAARDGTGRHEAAVSSQRASGTMKATRDHSACSGTPARQLDPDVTTEAGRAGCPRGSPRPAVRRGRSGR